MNILTASAEAAPYAKAGGLADVVAYLPVEWQKLGQNPVLIIPKYASIDTAYYGFKPTYLVLYVPMGNWTEFAHLWHGYFPGSKTPVYLIENNDYFNRPGIYGDPYEYRDNDRRFIFFSRAVFEAAKAINFYPDVINAHDYHAAFTMAFLKSQYRYIKRFSSTAGVFTIHNLAYQGKFNPNRAMLFSGFGMEQAYTNSWFEYQGAINAMKTGIMFADKITTVSPSYSYEIRLAEAGEGLEHVLNSKSGDLIGILNGVDYNVWHPATDNLIYKKYSINTLSDKKLNKISFLKERGIDDEDNYEIPLFGMVTRLTHQKGIDLLMGCIESYLAENKIRLTILGSGEQNYIDYFNYLAWKYPKNVMVYIGYSEWLAHRVIAGSDFFLLPSRFEPCGLTQMYALKYGTLPIVRSTGGLADTVHEYIPGTGEGTGFNFWQFSSDDMSYAMRRALYIYNNQPHWDLARTNAMKEDFSSRKSALEYIKVFQWAIEKVRGI